MVRRRCGALIRLIRLFEGATSTLWQFKSVCKHARWVVQHEVKQEDVRACVYGEGGWETLRVYSADAAA